MKVFRFGSQIVSKHFYNPGEQLGDIELRDLFSTVQKINQNRKSPIQHPYLQPADDLEDLRKKLSNQFLGVIYVDGEAMGFMFSPIIPYEKSRIVHAGLVVICNKKRKELVPLLSLCQTDFVGGILPECFITNISSTPSVVECFARAVDRPWPDPKANLIAPPKAYVPVFETLNEQYTDKFLRTSLNDRIIVDKKRFVIRTPSINMGFNTNLRELSRSQNFEYFNFCFAWLDYEKEEDIVQVGVLNFKAKLKVKKFIVLAKLKHLLQAKKDPKPIAPAESASIEALMIYNNNLKNKG